MKRPTAFLFVFLLAIPSIVVANWDPTDYYYYWHMASYDSYGQELWGRHTYLRHYEDFYFYDDDYIIAIALDPADNILVLGILNTYDILTPTLGVFSREHHEEYVVEQIWPAALEVGVSGAIVMAGTDWNDHPAILNFTAGWQAVYTDAVSGKFQSLAVDDQDSVYASGYAGDSLHNDMFTYKCDANGVEQWSAIYDAGGTDMDDEALAVVLNSEGNAIVTGESNQDIATIKYGLLGEQLWVVRVKDNGSETHEWPASLATDGEDNVIVAGTSLSAKQGTLLAIKYDSTGDLHWQKEYGIKTGDVSYQAVDLAVDEQGNVYLSGMASEQETVAIKYDPDGGQVWLLNYPYFMQSMAVDVEENLYSLGIQEEHYVIAKHDGAGNFIWETTYATNTSLENYRIDASGILVGASGNITFAGDQVFMNPGGNYGYDDDTYWDDDSGWDDDSWEDDDSEEDDDHESECDDFCQRAEECSLWSEVGFEQLECYWRCPEIREDKYFCVLAAGDCADMKACFQLGDGDEVGGFGCGACGPS